MTPRAPVSRAEHDALEARIEAMEKNLTELAGLLREMHGALMLPQPGHPTSLLDRIATVTVGIEAGERTAINLVRIAKGLAAVAAAMAIVAGALKLSSITGSP